MKNLFLVLSVIAVSATSCAQEKQFSTEALSQKLISAEGNDLPFENILNKHKGKTVMIEIWASWCGDCVKAMPLLKKTQLDNPDVDYVFVSMDKTADKWKEGIEKHDLKGDHYWAADGMKGKFGTAIDLDWIPRYIIIDKRGKVAIYRAIESDFVKINNALKSELPQSKSKKK